jgi:hypothetical protein
MARGQHRGQDDGASKTLRLDGDGTRRCEISFCFQFLLWAAMDVQFPFTSHGTESYLFILSSAGEVRSVNLNY